MQDRFSIKRFPTVKSLAFASPVYDLTDTDTFVPTASEAVGTALFAFNLEKQSFQMQKLMEPHEARKVHQAVRKWHEKLKAEYGILMD